MTWKLRNGWAENFRQADRDSAIPPAVVVAFTLPDSAPADLEADASAEGDGPLTGFIADWQGRSELYATYRRLQAEQVKVTARRAELTADVKRVAAELDAVLYNAGKPEAVEKRLEAVARDLRAAEYRAERLDALVPQSRKTAEAELRQLLEVERQRVAARLTAEMGAAASQLADAAESLAGAWYIKSNALHKVCHVYDKDRYILDAML